MGTPNMDRFERAARNQALFREVNDRLQELATSFQEIAGHCGVRMRMRRPAVCLRHGSPSTTR